jgi:hypothetical protein
MRRFGCDLYFYNERPDPIGARSLPEGVATHTELFITYLFYSSVSGGKYGDIEPVTKTTALEARGGIEPPIKVLQTFALPLGDRASIYSILSDRQPGITFREGYIPIWHHVVSAPLRRNFGNNKMKELQRSSRLRLDCRAFRWAEIDTRAF